MWLGRAKNPYCIDKIGALLPDVSTTLRIPFCCMPLRFQSSEILAQAFHLMQTIQIGLRGLATFHGQVREGVIKDADQCCTLVPEPAPWQ